MQHNKLVYTYVDFNIIFSRVMSPVSPDKIIILQLLIELSSRHMPRKQGSFGQHGAYLGPAGPMWAQWNSLSGCISFTSLIRVENQAMTRQQLVTNDRNAAEMPAPGQPT